jgi:uncharacterized protein (TIGR00288 family)
MKPWWLRPFAQGASEEPDNDDGEGAGALREPAGDGAEAAPAAGADEAAVEAPADRPAPSPGEEAAAGEEGKAEGAPSRRPRSRRPRGSRGRGAAPRAAEEAEAPAEEAPAERPERPERPEKPERLERLELPERLERLERLERRRGSRGGDDDEPAIGNAREDLHVSSERNQSVNDERKIALFCDLENIALGVRDSNEVKKFDINLILERLLEKGKIIVKKAYCDWERYSEFKRAFHEAAIELIDIPQKYYSGKNSADIKMVVDAMDLCYSKEHLDTFVLLSGDSDFSPLVSKLKENNKYVIGVGVKGASSNLLIANCDEFIYYEDIWRDQQKAPQLDGMSKKTAEAFSLMIDAIQALVRENKDVLWGSMIKQTMQRKKPSFNEGYYGYSTFSELLEDAEKKKVLKLKKDQRSGSYIVTGFADQR